MIRIAWIICFFGATYFSLFAQQPSLDSLVRLEKSYLTGDTIRAKLLTDLARRYYSVSPAKGLEYADKAIALAEKLSDKKYLAGAYSAKGTNKMGLNDYNAALELYNKALAINLRIDDQQGIANNYNNMGVVYNANFEYPKALEYYQKTLSINERLGNKKGLINALGNMGNIYNELRDYQMAIEYYQKALVLCEETGNMQAMSGILVNIGNAYTQKLDYDKALEYKQKALEISEKLGNKPSIANNLSNIGNVYTKLANYPQALQNHQRALAINESIQDKKGMASSLSGLSTVYMLQKNYPLAADYANKALQLSQSIGLLRTESEALMNLSKIYEFTNHYDSAYLAYRRYIVLRDSVDNVEIQKQVTQKTLQYEFGKKEDSLRQQQLITDIKLNQQILLAAKQKQELILKQNSIDLAEKERSLQHLAYLKTQADLQYAQSQNKAKEEQLIMAENEKKLQAAQVNLQSAQLQLIDKELQSKKTAQIFYILGIGLLILLSFFIFRNFKNQQKSNGIIRLEKKKSDDLLRNILPKEVADELKEKGEALARHYDAVTVLFTDFVDFTRFSESRSPQQLVSELHACFRAFDEIMDKHGLEKIKTIGDAYMAVSGLPMPDTQHALKAARAALEIQQYIQQRQQTQPGGFEIRIGLNSGPVVAGIVGARKFAYDIWGDTVNTAARMESSSLPGKINISGTTFANLRNQFQCTYRGKIPAKNKGDIDMYFLEAAQV